jgi:hypothetical protein
MTTKQDATIWAKTELIPFLDAGGDELGAPVDRLVFAAIVRRAAIAGIPIDELMRELEHHYNHQTEYMRRSSN